MYLLADRADLYTANFGRRALTLPKRPPDKDVECGGQVHAELSEQ